jgi:hypothetical protein
VLANCAVGVGHPAGDDSVIVFNVQEHECVTPEPAALILAASWVKPGMGVRGLSWSAGLGRCFGAQGKEAKRKHRPHRSP